MTCNKPILGELEAVSVKDIDTDPSVKLAVVRCYRGTAGHAIHRWSFKQLRKSSFTSIRDAEALLMKLPVSNNMQRIRRNDTRMGKPTCTLAAISLIETLYGSSLLQHQGSRWSDRRAIELVRCAQYPVSGRENLLPYRIRLAVEERYLKSHTRRIQVSPRVSPTSTRT